MKITKLSASNYRTLEDISLTFNSYYTAICGKNDSGKTNVVRAIRCLMREYNPLPLYIEGPEFSIAQDFTKWSDIEKKQRSISVSIQVEVDQELDTGLYQFLIDYLSIDQGSETLLVDVMNEQRADKQSKICVETSGRKFDGLKAEEVLQRMQKSKTFLFHSSVEPKPVWARYRSVLSDFQEGHSEKLEASKKSLENALKKIAKEEQHDIEDLLGRLRDKYKVGLTLPDLDLSYLGFGLTLGDNKVDVKLVE